MRSAAGITAALAAALLACKAQPTLPEGAALLFDVRFSAPDDKPGAPPKVHEAGTTQPFPSTIPSQIFMGQPTVVDALCGLKDQPLRLQSSTGTMGHEGVEFLLSQRYGLYHVELDMCVAQLAPPPRPASEPQLAVFLDFPQANAVGFFADGNVGLVDPERALAGDAAPVMIGRWSPNQPVHLSVDASVQEHTWKIGLDGKNVHEGALNAYLPRAIRVLLRGAETNVAAFDNFRVWGEHDLAAGVEHEPTPPKVGGDQ